MAKGIYFGVGNVAKKIKGLYIGIGGAARTVVKGYIGINGVAQQFYSSGGTIPVTITGTGYTSGGTVMCGASHNGVDYSSAASFMCNPGDTITLITCAFGTTGGYIQINNTTVQVAYYYNPQPTIYNYTVPSGITGITINLNYETIFMAGVTKLTTTWE